MWESFFKRDATEYVVAENESRFAVRYKCITMDESRWQISETLADKDVKAWRGQKRK